MISITSIIMKSSIQISKENKGRLAKLGTVEATYENVIVDLIVHAEKCNHWRLK